MGTVVSVHGEVVRELSCEASPAVDSIQCMAKIKRIPSESIAADATVPNVLDQLRRRIRRYVLLEGSALVLVVLGCAFWFSVAVDYWFEPGRGVRQSLLLIVLSAGVAAFAWYLVLRLVRHLRTRALALVLERRFPELNDRLITAVELAERPRHPSGLTAAMLQRTADEAAELVGRLELREVFNMRPLARAIGLAAVLIVSVAAFGLAAGEVFSTWFHRSVLFANEIYRRETDLRVFVLAEPGERRVEFKNGLYKHPCGGDLTFLAEVPEGKKVPDKVQFSYTNVAARGGTGDFLTKIGQRQFRYKLAGLHQSIDLSVRGGDFSTPAPLRVEVVEPPNIERLSLDSLYPEYTGLNRLDEKTQAPHRQPVAVLGVQVSLPAGTDLILEARTNKPLLRFRLQTERFEITAERGSAQASFATLSGTAAAKHNETVTMQEPLLAEDGRKIRVPCVLAVVSDPELMAADGRVHVPFRLQSDPVLRITLHDEDDIESSEPIRLAISCIPDEPPHVETRLKGIGNSITRQATIPVVGEARDPQDASKVYGVTDDYGIADAHFEYKVEAAKTETAKPDVAASDAAKPDAAKPALAGPAFQSVLFNRQPQGGKQFVVDEKFKVLPLDVGIGQRITLKVVAADADNLTGPHISSGTPHSFQVVSDDELLALVAVKELNIRRRFEQILEEVKNTRKDLILFRSRLDEALGVRSDPKEKIRQQLAALDMATVTLVERSINGIRKNANETQSIEQEFGDIRDELENNAVPDVKPMLERIDEGIITPLHSINNLDYNRLDDALVLLRKVLEEPVQGEKADPFTRFDESIELVNVTIERLEAVLAQMLKLETVNEALQMLRDIIKAQEELQEKTRLERKKKLLEGLQ